MESLPSGTVTFLFTDIEGSTKLAQLYPDKWESLRDRHHDILQSAMDAYNGYVFQIIGDAFCVAFHTASEGLNAAIEAQRKLQTEDWGNTPIKVRIGIHTGEAEKREIDYRGYMTLARVQRVMSVAYGNQVLLSNKSAQLVSNSLAGDIALRDMKEHRLKGLLDSEHIWQVVAPDLQQDFPPLSSLGTIPNNLPAQVNSFVGHAEEIAEIKQRLIGENASIERLHTIIGIGGVGKTRFSLQIASEVLSAFKDGVWFVELAPIRDVSLVAKTIAKTLGLNEAPGRSIEEILKDYLHGKELLLVLDNFEQVIDAASVVKDILSAAPHVKILVTSRIVLRITGEREYFLPLLSSPTQNQTYPLEQLSEYESVHLFIERAQAIKPDFALTNRNASAVAEICCRLEGLPLAIELAAANVRILTTQAILSQLDNRLKFLRSKARDLTTRQQTLRGAIDWSYELLTSDEQLIFRRLSVLVGTANLETIKGICNEGELEIIDLLEALVEKSLLQTTEKDGEIRFSILETLKEYTREKLEMMNETTSLCDRHLLFFKNFAEKIEPELLESDQVAKLDQVEKDFGNIRAAIRWARENHYTEILLRFTGVLLWFWQRRGHISEGITYLRDAITANDAENFPNDLAKALNSLGSLYFFKGDYISSVSMFDRGIRISRQQNNEEELAYGLVQRGATFMRLQKFDEGRASANKSLELYTKLEKKWGQGLAQFFCGRIELESGELILAEKHFQQSILDFQQSGDLWGQALSLNSLGSLYLQLGKLELAQGECEKSLALRELTRDQWGVNSCYLNLGDIARLQNLTMLETFYYRKSYELGFELGLKGDMARAANCLGFAALHSNEPQEAKAHFSKSLETYYELKHTRGICECLAGYAGLTAIRGKMDVAVKLLGVTDKVLKSNNIKMWRVDQIDFDTTLTLVHERLDDDTFSTAWSEGHVMNIEQAIAFAQQETNE
jgi:predicted ATPase/class 3 adenylate cyclase